MLMLACAVMVLLVSLVEIVMLEVVVLAVAVVGIIVELVAMVVSTATPTLESRPRMRKHFRFAHFWGTVSSQVT